MVEGTVTLKRAKSSGNAFRHAGPAIPANRKSLLVDIFYWYALSFFCRQFNTLRVKQGHAFAARSSLHPTLCISNHCNWWDGMTDFLLLRKVVPSVRLYVMIQELYRFPLLSWLGGFSIEKDSPVQAIQALDYGVKLLQASPRNLLWVYPQGKVMLQEQRPLGFADGIGYIIKKLPELNIIPVAQYYTFLHEDRPDVLLNVGQPLVLSQEMRQNRHVVGAYLEHEVTKLLDEIQMDLAVGAVEEYRVLIRGALNPFKLLEQDIRKSWEMLDRLLHPLGWIKETLPH